MLKKKKTDNFRMCAKFLKYSSIHAIFCKRISGYIQSLNKKGIYRLNAQMLRDCRALLRPTIIILLKVTSGRRTALTIGTVVTVSLQTVNVNQIGSGIFRVYMNYNVVL